MKAERRHELQENSLVRGVRTFPQFWKDYGSKISLVIILFLLALVLVRYWLGSREQTRLVIAEQLTSARTVLEQYRQGNAGSAVLDEDPQTRQFLMMASRQFGDSTIPIVFLGPEAETRIRGRVKDKVEGAVAEALKSASDPARQAEATLLRADMNLYFGMLAMAESSAAPATRPTTRAFERSPEDYFKTAATDYEALIAQADKIPAHTATSARFGLAAVHENRDERDKARALYDEISKSGPDATAKKLAAARIDLIARIPANPLLGPPSTPKADTQPATTKAVATQAATTQAATTQAATTQAATTQAATTQAATTPAATTPATKPTTQP